MNTNVWSGVLEAVVRYFASTLAHFGIQGLLVYCVERLCRIERAWGCYLENGALRCILGDFSTLWFRIGANGVV